VNIKILFFTHHILHPLHLIIHVVYEMKVYGLLQATHIYSIEIYMKELKDYVRPKNHPKGSKARIRSRTKRWKAQGPFTTV
jgi:hypothetical protein